MDLTIVGRTYIYLSDSSFIITESLNRYICFKSETVNNNYSGNLKIIDELKREQQQQ